MLLRPKLEELLFLLFLEAAIVMAVKRAPNAAAKKRPRPASKRSGQMSISKPSQLSSTMPYLTSLFLSPPKLPAMACGGGTLDANLTKLFEIMICKKMDKACVIYTQQKKA